MSEIKQPQDRKPKVEKFTFNDAAGKEHVLPLASEGAANVPGRVTRDAIMSDDEKVQMRLGFALLEACGAKDSAVEAIYSLPTERMMEVLYAWMQHGDGDGASLGK